MTNTMEEKFYYLRQWLGITQKDIDLKHLDTEEEVKIPDTSERVFRLSREQLEKRNRKIVQNFAAGKRYRFLQGAGDRDFIFEYVKKEGIHHMFREIHGGWSRTYTDSQLTEKKFEEVENA